MSDYIPTEEEVKNYFRSIGLGDEANVKPAQSMIESGERDSICNFCAAPKNAADLVEGPMFNICRDCIHLSMDVIANRRGKRT